MTTGNFVWSWRDARFGAVITAIPFVVMITGHVEAGLPLLIGSLPAALVGLLPTKKQRKKLVVLGLLFGVFLMLGSFMAQWVWVAIPGMFMLAFGSAILASRRPFGVIALTLCVPVAGVGLSYGGLENSVGLGLLIILGSIVAYGWSLCFKEHDQPLANRQAKTSILSKVQSQNYGIRLGVAVAISTSIGYALGADHIGWITGATLFVMRPDREVQKLRSVGRAVSVFIGAMIASWLLTLNLQPVIVAILSAGALIMASATHTSRWYITPAFSTFLVFWILLYGEPTITNIEYRFNERVFETLLGISIAYVFGIVVPYMASRLSLRDETY